MRFAIGLLVGLVLAPVLLAVAGSLGFLPISATATPSAWESRAAGRAVRASLAKEAIGLASPVPANEENLRIGMKLYRMNCAGCHGDFGSPSPWGATGFYPRVPQFAERSSLLTTPEMFLAVKHGIRYSGMGAWSGMLSDEDIWRTVSFVSHVRKLPPAVKEIWMRKPPAAPAGS
jgi:mono/diheme cytochrome c family protein